MKSVMVICPGNERGGAATHIVVLAEAIQHAGERSITFACVGTGDLHRRLSQLGVHVIELPAGLVAAQATIRRHLGAESGVQLVHAHGPRMNVLTYAAVRGTRIPWVTTLHSDPRYDFLASRVKSVVFPRLNLWCIRRSDAAFVVNREFCACAPGKPCFYVPNGIALRPLPQSARDYRAVLTDRLAIDANASVIGVVARLDPVKDIATIIRALSRMNCTHVHLVIAGDGPERQALADLARQLGVAERVHFLGFVDDPRWLYSAMDVHVLPSRREGMGYSVLEAGLLGTPSVAADTSGVRQLIEHDETGLLFTPGDVDQLARRLDELLADPTRAHDLAARFRQHVVPRFTPERMLEAYMQGYEVLLEHHMRRTERRRDESRS